MPSRQWRREGNMRLGLLLIVLSIPLVELAVLIKVGHWIGFWPTMLIVVTSAIGGFALLHRQGFSAVNRMMAAMREGQPPIDAAVDSAFIIFAAVLLITPGLLADACGLALLIAPLRRAFARSVLKRMGGHVEVRTSWDERPREPGRASPYDPREGGVVIDGEFKRIDDPPPTPENGPGGRGPPSRG